MKTKYTLFRRGAVYYSQDSTTGKQTSLRTKDETEVRSLLNARHEAQCQPVLNLHLARAYITKTSELLHGQAQQVHADAGDTGVSSRSRGPQFRSRLVQVKPFLLDELGRRWWPIRHGSPVRRGPH
jgi:hypothetical protein